MEGCNLCGSSGREELFSENPAPGDVFAVVRCPKCGLVFTFPQPDQGFLGRLYGDESYETNTVSGRYCLEGDLSRRDHHRILDRLEAYTKGRRLLDVGCGTGAFLSLARERKWDVYGIEPSTRAGRLAASRHPRRVRIMSLREASFGDGFFDAVTLLYVLEHVPDPADTLRRAAELLRTDGLLFIVVPNVHYILFKRRLVRLVTGKPGSIHAHEHLFHYGSSTLKAYLEKAGFILLDELVANPYLVSASWVNILKRVAGLGARVLFRLSGINLGGIMMLACKGVSRIKPSGL
jgi:2-polyprenyl-3-methyl-5-hydroxy-6-metoxy-1,4-benzoquinol methylase